MGLFGWLKKAPEIKKAEFVSPATGKIIPVDQVEDETFASKILGDGFAVELTDGEVIAPFDGEVTAAFPTGHAYGLKREDSFINCFSTRKFDSYWFGYSRIKWFWI